MRQSRRVSKKINYKTVQDDSEEEENLDFQDSGSDASINNEDDEDDDSYPSSGEDFAEVQPSAKKKTPLAKRKSCPSIPFKSLKKAMQKNNDRQPETVAIPFSVKDLTDQEKLLPNFLDLSESDSDSDTEVKEPKKHFKQPSDCKSFIANDPNDIDIPSSSRINEQNGKMTYSECKVGRLSDSDSDNDLQKDSSNSIPKETVPKKLNFENIREHNKKLEEVKKSLELYNKNHSDVKDKNYDVGALLAIGETAETNIFKPQRPSLSDSDDEDMEEVEGEASTSRVIPKDGIQVTVNLPSNIKKKKEMDLEMVLKRRINRVKKEYQIYMHQVHILCWIAHGNYVNKILNDMEVMSAALSLLPSKHSYPSNRINIKYLEQICKWFSDYFVVEEDKTKLKFRTNREPLSSSLLQQINKKKFNSCKNKVLIFISLLRALGVKCRLVLNFRTVAIRPSTEELCSLSKKKSEKKGESSKYFKSGDSNQKQIKKELNKKSAPKTEDKIPQVDGADDFIIKKVPQKRSKRLLSQIKDCTEETVKSDDKQEAGNSNCSSYWDKITQNSALEAPKRVSHRDLKNSNSKNELSVNASTSSENGNVDKKPVKSQTKSVSKKSSSKIIVTSSRDSEVIESKRDITKISNKRNTNTVSRKSINSDVPESTSNKASKPVKRKATSDVGVKSSKSKRVENQSASVKNVTTSVPKNEPEKNQTRKSLRGENKSNKASSSSAVKKSSTSSKVDSKYFENVKTKSGTKNPNFDTSLNSLSLLKNKINKKRSNSDGSDEDFSPPKKKTVIKKSGVIDRRVLSTDSEHSNDNVKRKGLDVWCEVYVEEEEQWVSVDVIKGQVHCVSQIYNRSSHPVSYIVSWDMNNYIKDVTRRYVPHWNTTTRKMRTKATWYEAATRPWMAPPHLRDKREDDQLDRMQLDAPLPQTVSEFKNHPLYVLKRHLLKFEALYPPDPAILGFVRKEPVYARECVHVCRSRETWVKEAKVVKPGEKPYKIVKARPKYDKLSGQMICDIPLEIFGPWQCEDYVPPVAENGVVPRNPYGNVELFKPCMLPGGTVHITLPGLNKVAKKLGIDCAPAMVGFDYHSGGSHPLYDGFVVCEEFKETIIAAWEQEQEEAENRAKEKIEKRVYGNWKRLIRGLFIRERLQAKYDFNLESESTSSGLKKSKK